MELKRGIVECWPVAAVKPRVSVVVAARNEAEHVEQCIRSIMTGTLPPGQVELIVVDSASTDSTRKIITRLAGEFPAIRILDNPCGRTPNAFNIGIRAASANAVCIMSAHAYFSPGYLESALRTLDETGADAVGGSMNTLHGYDSLSARLIRGVTTSRFGVGGSPFRLGGVDGPVATVVFGVYRRSVFERVGLFDERLIRNQDNELNARLKAAGGKLHMFTGAPSYYYNRKTLSALLRQNVRNGIFGILTWKVTPASMTLRHTAPLAFLLFLVLGGLGALFSRLLLWPYLAVLGLYAALAISAGIAQAIRCRDARMLLCIPIFPLLHLGYGVGLLVGIVRFAFRSVGGQGPQKLPPADREPAATQR